MFRVLPPLFKPVNAQHRYSTRFAAMSQNKWHASCCPFHCTLRLKSDYPWNKCRTNCYIIIIIIITILTTWITERKTKDTISEQRHTEHNSSISRDRFCTSSPSFPILSLSSSNPLRCLSNSCFSLLSFSSSCLSCASRTLRAADSSLILTAVAPRSASA